MEDDEDDEVTPKRFRDCICPTCGYVTSYRKGTPCYMRRCPECGSSFIEA